MKIVTDHKVRLSKYYPQDMSAQEKRKVERAYGGLIPLEDAEFIFYRGYPYYMADCMRLEKFSELAQLGWDGRFDETFFSCVVVKERTTDQGEIGYVFGLAFS